MLSIITSLLILSGIAALLALFLEIADSYLADYGEKQILINEQKQLVVEGGRPLLSTLMGQGIFIPSACGGKGTCSYCKVKVLQGGGPVLPTETPYLSPDELNAHIRLSCQVKVKDNLRIEIPEELFLVKEYLVKVESLRDLTPEIKSVRLTILWPDEGITFRAGQYVQFEVPKYKLTSGPEYRAYSISSDASEHQSLELVITKVPQGSGDHLRARLPEGGRGHHHLGLALLHRELGNAEAFAQHWQKAEELGKQTTLVDWPHRWHVAQARVKESEGDFDAALDLLDEAKRVYVKNPAPDLRPVEALKARVYLSRDDWTKFRPGSQSGGCRPATKPVIGANSNCSRWREC